VRGFERRAEEDGDESDWEDDWDEDEDWESDEDCGVEALVPGAVVHEAELSLTGDGAVFTKIELVG
jgi:hypothetical protein